MGTTIDTRLIEEDCVRQQGIENIVRRCDELSGFAGRRAMWESRWSDVTHNYI